jgi:predicted nucleic acid-binding Zn ribbon protein
MTSRNVSVTARCRVCGGPLPPEGRPRTTCSDRCRQKAWRLRHQAPVAIPELPPAQPRKAHTVYECVCHEREGGVM